MKRIKLTNWFSNDNPEKNKLEQPLQQTDVKSDAKLAKMQSTIEKLNQELQKSHKELAQTKAQLQINQGFQIELGETQLKVEKTAAESQR